MTPYFDEQPLRKLLGTLSPTINWLSELGSVDVAKAPGEHLDSIKQLERIGVVHKRNNRQYELQKVRLRKLMDSMGMDRLTPVVIAEPTSKVLETAIPVPVVDTVAVN
jgi:hypothetical protein